MNFRLSREGIKSGPYTVHIDGHYVATFDGLPTALMNVATYYLPELGPGQLQDIGEFVNLLDRASFYYQDDFGATRSTKQLAQDSAKKGLTLMNKLLDSFKGHWVPARYEVAKELFERFKDISLVVPGN